MRLHSFSTIIFDTVAHRPTLAHIKQGALVSKAFSKAGQASFWGAKFEN